MVKEITKGQGCMRVSIGIHPDLNSPVTADEWHKALLLPDNYEVTQIERREETGLFELTLLSEDIPTGEGISVIPVYIALFDKDGTKTPQLDHIEMSRWNGEQWEEVK